MILFPSINLPKGLSTLLKANINASVDSNSVIIELLQKDENLIFFIQEKFLEFDKEKRIERIVSSLGWKNFRNRLTSCYLHHAEHGKYPQKTLPNDCSAIEEIEDKLLPYTIDGYSRSFLFGLYLKMSKIYLAKEDNSSNYPELDIPSEVIECLKMAGSKVLNIDWTILLLMHLYHIKGAEELKQLVERSEFNFKEIFSGLGKFEKKRLIENFLTYGQAIGDSSPFIGQGH